MTPPCPWQGLALRQAEFCEASLCAWIRQPGNAWTSFAYVLVGLAILRASRRDRCQHLRGLVLVALATGLGSAFFHASETFVGRLLDYSGMYMGAAYMFVVDVRRWLLTRRLLTRLLFWGLVAGPLLLMFVDDHYAMGLYIALLACCPVMEGILYWRQRGKPHPTEYRWFFACWLAFCIAYALWWLDKRRILCDPENHWISGHGAWHLLGALALYLVYLYYRQFDVLRFREEAKG